MGKKVINVFGILAAVILSVVLLATLIAAPVVSACTSLVQEKTMHKLVESIDFSGLVAAGEDDPSAALFETEFFAQLLTLYTDDVLAALDGKEQTNLTEDALNALVQEHMDELVPFMRAMLEDEETDAILTDDVLEQAVTEMFATDGGSFLEMFPPVEALGIDAGLLEGISVLRSKAALTSVIIAVVVLSLLVYGCRWPRFKGFMWLAVVYFLGAGATALIGLSVSAVVPALLMAELEPLMGVFLPILTMLKNALLTGALVELALVVVFVLVFVFGRKALKKRKAAQAAAAVEAPSQPAIAEPEM